MLQRLDDSGVSTLKTFLGLVFPGDGLASAYSNRGDRLKQDFAPRACLLGLEPIHDLVTVR